MEKISVEKNKENVEKAWEELQELLVYLSSIGLRIRNITKENLEKNIPFPLVYDGIDGIRASYHRREGCKVWFTNGFEDQNNETRKKVTEKWRVIKNSQ